MASFLQPDLISVAFCWRIDRRDGISLGFTSHDRDLMIGGIVYRAGPGMLPSAISLSDGFEIDTLDVSGALTSGALTDRDLSEGRWDGARVRLFATNWEEPGVEIVQLARGELGDIGIRDGSFTAELRGPTALLEQPVVELTSPECRAELGDKRCRVDMAARRRLMRVAKVASPSEVEFSTPEPVSNAYGYGLLRWLNGSNSGLSSQILLSNGVSVTLREPPPNTVDAGAMVELIEGCDKCFDTCRERFRNAANFRGEPYLPGNDLLTRYPGA